jgi:hypothetical protein
VSSAQQAQWAHFLGSSQGGKGVDISVDSQGNVYTVGGYGYNVLSAQNPIDFDPGPGVFAFTPALSGGASYISKLNAQGNFVWARSFAINGQGYANITQCALNNQGNLLVAGVFIGSVDFNLGSGVFNVVSSNPTLVGDSTITDFFIASYSSAGNFQWVKTFPCDPLTVVASYPIANSTGLVIDIEQNILLPITFRGRVDLNPGLGEDWKECYGLNYNAAVIKLSSQGEYILQADLTQQSLWQQMNGIIFF